MSSSSAPEAIHAVLEQHFPGAVTLSDLMKSIEKVLESSVNLDNVLFGISSCVDEINRDLEHSSPNFGRPFNLGGLAGLPFVGVAGFGAFEHHVPDEGTILIVFSSHVGIDPNGKLGKVQRHGMCKPSDACGAAIGGIQSAWVGAEPAAPLNGQFVDIYNHLLANVGEFGDDDKQANPDAASPFKFVPTDAGHAKLAHVISKKIQVDLETIIAAFEAGEKAKGHEEHKKIVIVGGIQINLEPVDEGAPSAHKHWKKKSLEKQEQDYFLVTHVSVKNAAGSPLSELTIESLKNAKKNKKDKKDKKKKEEE